MLRTRYILALLAVVPVVVSTGAAPAPVRFLSIAHIMAPDMHTMREIDFTAFTHVMHGAIGPRPDGSLSIYIDTDQSEQMISQAHAAGAKAYFTVMSGWSPQDDFDGAASPENLKTFVANLVSFMTIRGYDGINLDWEPLEEPELQTRFKNLVAALRTALDHVSPRGEIAAEFYGTKDVVLAVQSSLDQIHLMTYDQAAPAFGTVKTWHNAALHNPYDPHLVSIDDRVAEYAAAGIDLRKVTIGIPFYGVVWEGVTAPLETWTKAPATFQDSYRGIMDSYSGIGSYHWDSGALVPYISIHAAAGAGDMFISFDDPRSVAEKVKWAIAQGLLGVTMWHLNMGFNPNAPAGQKHPLVSAIKAALPPPPPADAPTITPNGGVFTGPVTVTLASATPNASIVYSTDGSAPSVSYTGPFTVAGYATVRAQASAPGLSASAVSSAVFTVKRIPAPRPVHIRPAASNKTPALALPH